MGELLCGDCVQFKSECRCYECEQCGHARGGLNDVLCDCDMLGLTDKIEAMEALSNLASCLRWAGALERAFNLGAGFGYEWATRHPFYPRWESGCQQDASKAEARRLEPGAMLPSGVNVKRSWYRPTSQPGLAMRCDDWPDCDGACIGGGES